MTPPDPTPGFQPRTPTVLATVIFILTALTLCYPMLGGQIIWGGDQITAGYAFRLFATNTFHATGQVPQWNPFIFGGMPLLAVPGHMDFFYPTAWLRLLLPVGLAMSLGFFIHLVVAGLAMYALLRGLRAGWTAALVAGVGYELSGILASQLSPGHDGKLYVEALAPLAFLALLKAIRHRQFSGYAWFALVIGLAMLTPHYQAAYYLMIASGIFTLWLALFDPERPRDRSPAAALAMAAIAVTVGAGIAMIEVLPVLHYVQYTPRGAGGASTGWEYATSWAMPVEELMTGILPQFNGMLNHYWGQNGFKSHTEYLGVLIVALAALGVPAMKRRGLLAGFGVIAGLFLLVAFGGHTPFYHLWILLPKMSQFRAAGMAFYLVALPVCIAAGFGVERLLAGEVSSRAFWWTMGVLGGIGILGAAGILQGIAEAVARSYTFGDSRITEYHVAAATANAPELARGAVRLLLFVVLGVVGFQLVRTRVLAGWAASAVLVLLVGADNWSILRSFMAPNPPATQLFADDEIAAVMKQSPMPFRSFDPKSPPSDGGDPRIDQLNVYQGSSLMAQGVPTLLGYHGMESKYFDALLGGKNRWLNQLNPAVWDLYAVNYIVLPVDAGEIPGYRKKTALTPFTNLVDKRAQAALLYQRDSAPDWVRVVPGAIKVPEAQVDSLALSGTLDRHRFVVFADTVGVQATSAADTAAVARSAVMARLTAWQPGAMTVSLTGADSRTTFLMVAENWYPDWRVQVDGKATPPLRGDGALLTVALPPGAKEVTLRFDVAAYHTGRMITLLCLTLVAIGLAVGWSRRRTADV